MNDSTAALILALAFLVFCAYVARQLGGRDL